MNKHESILCNQNSTDKNIIHIVWVAVCENKHVAQIETNKRREIQNEKVGGATKKEKTL